MKQRHNDFVAMVTDNCSTDHTVEVFKKTVGHDQRFHYLCLPNHASMAENFYISLNAIDSDYFMWRADDDLSDLGYVSTLLHCLQSNDDVDLAVSSFKFAFYKAGQRFTHGYKSLPEIPCVCEEQRAKFFLENTHAPTWIYGVWRRNNLLQNWEKTLAFYPYTWAMDHLLLLPSILRGRISFTNKTWFFQRVFDEPKHYEQEVNCPQDKLNARSIYTHIASQVLAEVDSLSESGLVRSSLRKHIDRKVGKLWSLKRQILLNKAKRAFHLD